MLREDSPSQAALHMSTQTPGSLPAWCSQDRLCQGRAVRGDLAVVSPCVHSRGLSLQDQEHKDRLGPLQAAECPAASPGSPSVQGQVWIWSCSVGKQSWRSALPSLAAKGPLRAAPGSSRPWCGTQMVWNSSPAAQFKPSLAGQGLREAPAAAALRSCCSGQGSCSFPAFP